MKFDLLPTGTGQPPEFLDAKRCRDWCSALPLSNPLQAQAQLLRQMQLLNGYTLLSETRCAILEALREPVLFIQGEMAKRFTGRPLPLAPPEKMALDGVTGLWRALSTGYLHCIEATFSSDNPPRAAAGLACQRALAVYADLYADMLRAGTQPEAGFWSQVHAIYKASEALAVTAESVEDPQRSSQPGSPAAAYAEIMLLAAANLHELSPRPQAWAMRWSRRWAGKISVLAVPPPLDTPALPLCVDLDSMVPAGFRPLTGPGARWLETSALRISLKKRLTLLARGDPADTPARLGLGEDCTQPACGELLKRLYPRWVKGGVARRQERHPMSGACRFVIGVDAIHYYLSGRAPFRSPGPASGDELRRQREELATFGRVAERFEEEYSRNHGFQLENWEVVEDWGMLDQSNGGLRLVRPLGQAGGRLGIGQLAAVQPAGGNSLLLAAVRWVQVLDDKITAGIMVLPGKPVPVAVRGTGVMANHDIYKPGFLLPPNDALGLTAIAVLPPGSFKPERIMEAWTSTASHRIRLKTLMERGSDFERAGFEEMPAGR